MKIQASNNGRYLDKMSVDIRKAIRSYLAKIGASPQFSTVLENDEVLRIRVDSIDRAHNLANYVYERIGDPMLHIEVIDNNVLEIREATNDYLDEPTDMSSEDGLITWAAKYFPLKGNAKKVYFTTSSNDYDEVSHMFEMGIPEPYRSARVLGRAPSIHLLEQDGFEEIDIFGATTGISVEGANNYGGAYDIDPEVFFTRDDLNELAEEVMNHVEETFSGKFKLTDIYVDGSNNQDIFIEVDWFDTGITYMANIHIDMRSIRRPSDLTKKYALPLAANLIEQMREDAPTVVESATDSINAASPDDYLNPPEYDEPYILDEEQETIEVDIDAIIIIDEEGSWEYEDEEYPWARPADGDTDWYSEIYPSLVLSDHINIVEIVDIKISDKLPDEPGRYHITGHFSMTFEISNVEEISTYIGRDEDDSPAFDTEYYIDDAEVDRISKKDKLVDFKCVKLGDIV